PAIGQRRSDIAHRARRHEHGGFLAKQIGDAGAELIGGRIVADLLVADLSLRHRLAHRRRRSGLGVRQQVDAHGGRLRIGRGRGVVHDVSLGRFALTLAKQKGPGKTGAFPNSQC
ncbi:hypothetical protein chiPu_0027846, partial [Chiloscyllium punctatum]|nr:hypothetical protein [Chiloscyllium punctatum]